MTATSVRSLRLPGQMPGIAYLWRLFTSVRFALLLILMLAGGFFLGVIVSQVPQEVSVSPADYAAWVETEARSRYGVATNLLFLLGLFDVFHAAWFRSLLVLLVTAICICTLNRFPAIYQSTIKAKPIVNDGFLHTSRNRAEFELTGGQEALVRTLRSKGYRTTVIEQPGLTHIYADRNGWAKYATFVSHLGLIMFLFGGMMTNLLGYQRFLVIPDGESQPLYPVFHPQQMQVFNQGFTVHYYEDGRPADYYSDLVIYKGGKEEARGRIRVNEPMDVDGFRFHQNSFGPTIGIEIDSTTGQKLFSETMVLGQAFGSTPFEMVNVPTTDISAVVALAEGNTTSNVVGGTFIRGGQEPRLAVMAFRGDMQTSQPLFVAKLAPGETFEGEGLKVTFRGTHFFTGVVARSDPGAVYIWMAAALFIPAILVTFWCARRRVWAQASGNHVRLAGMADRFIDLQREIDEIVSDLGRPTEDVGQAPSPVQPAEPAPAVSR